MMSDLSAQPVTDPKQSQFKYTIPATYKGLSERANAILRLASISERLALEDRTLLKHVGGRAENVAEHSNMLSIIAPALAEELYPDIDPNEVARYASIHDIIEAYVGDTPTHRFSAALHESKASLEAAGIQKLRTDFAFLPKFVELVNRYEEQLLPAPRLVRVVDKLMPFVLHYFDGGIVLKQGFTREQLLENSAQRAQWLRTEYPEFEAIIQLREEFAAHTAQTLLS